MGSGAEVRVQRERMGRRRRRRIRKGKIGV